MIKQTQTRPDTLAMIPLQPSLTGAACKGQVPLVGPLWDDYVNGETAEQRDARHDRAREFCRRCPELMACLRLRRDDPTLPAGIWGGCHIGRGPQRTVHASPIRVDRRSA